MLPSEGIERFGSGPFCLAGIFSKLQEVFYGRRQRKWIHVVFGRTGNWGSGRGAICATLGRGDAGSYSGQGRGRPRFRKEPRPSGSRPGRRLGGTRQGCGGTAEGAVSLRL